MSDPNMSIASCKVFTSIETIPPINLYNINALLLFWILQITDF